jgi:type I site-specific restriction-modification system R (restriction) subunit
LLPAAGATLFAIALIGFTGYTAAERFPEYLGPIVSITAVQTISGAVTHVRDGDTIEVAGMQRRAASTTGITYVAFTANPKAKTLELFGRRPDRRQPASSTNLPEAFQVYSMRQAIEEGFILDVLKNYTPYSLAFRLAGEGKEMDEKEVERAAAVKALMRWVRLHPYNISQKVQIVVEHYRAMVQPLLEGKAKAMVVVGNCMSRCERARRSVPLLDNGTAQRFVMLA